MSTPISQGDGPSLEGFAVNPIQDGMLKEASFPRLDMDGNFVDIKKKSKPFYDGPLPPESPSQNQNGFHGIFKSPDLVNVKKPPLAPRYECITPGLIKFTGKKGVDELVENLDKLQSGTTGAISEEGIVPKCDQYIEGIHFFVEQKVARGSFGTGKICTDSEPPYKKFFLKKMAKEDFRSSEVIVPMNLNHENLTKFYGLIQREEENGQIAVEMMIELAGCALNIFVQKKELTISNVVHITRQIMSGVNQMHFYGMIHFDIKPENICVQEREVGLLVKVTDFGSSKLPQEKIEFVGWTPEYMSPESSLFFLQKSGVPLSKEITEADITGKHDVYSTALVIMYMYEKVHVLQRLITRGKTTYADIPVEMRQLLQMNLLKMLAEDPCFIQPIIPDKCDIDMRELLLHMTQHSPEQRYSAHDVISFIDRREKRENALIKESERKMQLRQQEKERVREQELACVMSTVDMGDKQVPDIAYKCLQTETGPIRMVTKDRLRQKLKPYPWNGKGKVIDETPVQEMRRLQTINKPIDEFQPPPTPVTEVVQYLANLDVKSPGHTTERNAPVTQPEETRQVYRQSVNQPVMVPIIQPARPEIRSNRSTANNKVLPPQPIKNGQTSATTSVRVEQVSPLPDQKQVMIEQLKKGRLKIAMTEKGPMLVQVQVGTLPLTPNPTGVRPFMPASPGAPDNSEPDLMTNNTSSVETGNIPDFMKLC